MRCPHCKEVGKDKVIDSRLTESSTAIRRHRVCQDCGRRFTTKERVEEELRLMVLKKDGTKVPYRRDKIEAGIRHACHKLAVSDTDIQTLLDQIEGDLFTEFEREVASSAVGHYVARKLRGVNHVAYVRFMSVYREFRDVSEFAEAIQTVQDIAAGEAPNQQSLFK